ncbi:serine/threonine-protein kinase [Nocardia inohanensis]|uniref:serine/threonine-protein kinase n=1 Tax=Nocardia inohanensis TaxID=209246 RepID=UPI001FDFE45A|nr:serine/threonine-protein kinase [Nocardia inohanensis]
MSESSLLPGTVFAGYRIERELGSGGMGAVYVVRHPRLPRRDALKVLAAQYGSDPEFRARFVREAELAARLDHPNIVAVHDRGVEQGRLWIAMQFVDGSDASALIRAAPEERAPQRILRVITEAARGLDEAHRNGLLHRDVKPANILLESRSGRPERILVTDFGIAKAAAGSTALTETGTVLATLAYAAPEQLTGRPVDHHADVYALGCTAFELLTGYKPFRRANPGALMAAHLYEAAPAATALHPGLPPAVDDVLARALAKAPGDRYPSCGVLAAELAGALGFPAQAAHVVPLSDRLARTAVAGSAWAAGLSAPDTGPTAVLRARPASRRRSRLIGLGAVIAVGLLIGGIGVWWYRSGEPAADPLVAGTTPSTTATVKTWGSHDYIARAFANLLPVSPDAAGYQGIRCAAVDDDQRPASLTAPATGVNHLSCSGNKDPVELLVASCNADRTAEEMVHLNKRTTVTGDEDWHRSWGRGHLAWGDVDNSDWTIGILSINFLDNARKNCWLEVFGSTSGAQLREQWWPDAPL